MLLFIQHSVFPQTYGNEWIDYGQTYYTFQIEQESIHRIDKSTLANAGVPVNSIDPRNIQIFGREKEIPIYIKGEGDGSFDSGDFIEFYAKANDGWIDSLVYERDSVEIANPHFSLYNDRVNYFLTWNNSTNNKRVDKVSDFSFASYPSPSYLWKKRVMSASGQYLRGVMNSSSSSSSLFSESEGWFGSSFGKSTQGNMSSDTRSFYTGNAYTGGSAPDATVSTISGTRNSASSNDLNHHLQITYSSGFTAVDTSYEGYQLNKFTFTIPGNRLNDPTTSIKHQVIDDLGVSTDLQAVSTIEFSYPQTMALNNQSQYKFSVPFLSGNSKVTLNLQDFDASNALLYRINGNTHKRISVQENSGTFKAVLPQLALPNKADCFLTSVSSINKINNLRPVTSNGKFTDFGSKNLSKAFLIVTHNSLMSSANAYANYRNNTGFNSLVANVEELYFQYGGGVRKNAFAITRFAKHLLNTWSKDPKYLFLIGKSIRQADEGAALGARKHSGNFSDNLVPTYGYPGGDNLFTAGLNGEGRLVPAIPTGRVSAQDDNDVKNYLDKVRAFENQQNKPKAWMKRVMHFGGGITKSQQDRFAGYLENYKGLIEGMKYTGNVHTFLKTTSDPIQISVSDSIQNLIDAGTSLLTFFGHASGGGFDQNIDDPQKWSNQGKYPVLLANACYAGDVHLSAANSTSEKFVLIEDKGVIAFLANVKSGYINPLNQYSTNFYKNLSLDNYGQSIGKIIQNTIKDYNIVESRLMKEIHTAGMSLHGDPSLKVNTFPKPELSISS
ncbi:MAG: C25 family cysteine peptidase, partial [Flavobacteriales bacterium]